MISIINNVMNGLALHDYWVIDHEINKYSISYVNSTYKCENTNIRKIDLYFIYGIHILGKISFSVLSYDVLLRMIKDYINQKSYYINVYYYSHNNIKYIQSNQTDIMSYDKYKEIVFNETEKFKKNCFDYLSINNIYIADKTKVFIQNQLTEQYNVKSCIQISYFNKIFKMVFKEILPRNGIYEDIIADCDKERDTYNNNITDEENKYSVLKVSREIFSTICRLFVEGLNGYLLLKNNSFIKKSEIGTQLLRKEITIIDNPFFKSQEFFYDSEGIELRIKKLINKGVVNDCLNDIVTSNALGLQPGNAQYDYFLNTNMIKSSIIIFEYNISQTKTYAYYDGYIISILDNNVILDTDTGKLVLNCMGINNEGKAKQYKLNINITDFLNSIVHVEGEHIESNGCIVPEVIVRFGGNND